MHQIIESNNKTSNANKQTNCEQKVRQCSQQLLISEGIFFITVKLASFCFKDFAKNIGLYLKSYVSPGILLRPSISPSIYYYFLSLPNAFSRIPFNYVETVKTVLQQYFDSKKGRVIGMKLFIARWIVSGHTYWWCLLEFIHA